ncbi:hypothetical protein NAL19_438 [Pectobacterium sp. F1-1]|nr:hypothetical protein NAL19_438 [Pectobacterium sp. F1-1]
MANKIGIKTLLILITSFTVFIALTVLLIRLGIASVFFFKDGFFTFRGRTELLTLLEKVYRGGFP